MKKIVLTFGLIAGGVLAVMMLASAAFMDPTDFETAEVFGYTTLVLAFLLVYFGIRAYRDSVLDGTIRFGRAFKVGLLITAVASVCYVATWQVVYYGMYPDFAEKYAAHSIEKAKAAGATQQELDEKAADAAKFREMYKNPLFNIAITFVEPFPIGLVVALVSAGVLSRRRKGGGSASTVVPGSTAAAQSAQRS